MGRAARMVLENRRLKGGSVGTQPTGLYELYIYC